MERKLDKLETETLERILAEHKAKVSEIEAILLEREKHNAKLRTIPVSKCPYCSPREYCSDIHEMMDCGEIPSP